MKAKEKTIRLKGTLGALGEDTHHVTETLSFRVPTGERERLRIVFAHRGMTLTEGLKKGVYEFVDKLEGK